MARRLRPDPNPSGYIALAVVAIMLLAATGVLVGQAWHRTARQTVGEQGATIWLVVKVGAGLAVAGGLGVPVGEVARAFFEHGLSDFQSGALKLRPAEIVTKSTLYPDQV